MTIKVFFAGFLLFLILGLNAFPQNINDFNGTWIGEVEIIYSTQVPDISGQKAKVKLVINKNNVDLYTFKTNLNSRGKYLTSWKEFMKDKLEIRRLESNAVITGIESGADEYGKWIDSLSIELSRIDRKYAAVNFSKQVHNLNSGHTNVFGIGKLEVVNNNNR